MGAGKPDVNGREMIDDFRLWGARRCRQMGRHLSDGVDGLTWRRSCYLQRLSLRGRSPSSLWLRTYPKRRIRRGTTRISRVGCRKAKRGGASPVPASPGVTARRMRGVLVVRAPPCL